MAYVVWTFLYVCFYYMIFFHRFYGYLTHDL